MKVAPQIEAEFAQLNRDYDINKKNYDVWLRGANLPACRGTRMTAGVADFRLIDPPRVSKHPWHLTVSSCSGALLVRCWPDWREFATSQFRPVFFDRRSLREVLVFPSWVPCP